MPLVKPATAVGYTRKDIELVRSACLSLATYLGSFIDDLVVVGGLVPTLLIPSEHLRGNRESHVGTHELDLGLSLAILDESRYIQLVAQLKSANFAPDINERGKPANHRWKHQLEPVTVDFLIAPSGPPPTSGNTKIRPIEDHLSAVIAAGLPLAFGTDKRSRSPAELSSENR